MSEELKDIYSEYGLSETGEELTKEETEMDIEDIVKDVITHRDKDYVPASDMETTLVLDELFDSDIAFAEKLKASEEDKNTDEIPQKPLKPTHKIYQDKKDKPLIFERITVLKEKLQCKSKSINPPKQKKTKAKRFPVWAQILSAVSLVLGFGIAIYFASSFRYTVYLDGNTYKTRSISQNAAEVLKQIGAEFDDGSRIDTEKEGKEIFITVIRPFNVTFKFDGKTKTVETTGDTVKNLLPTKLNDYDTVSVPLNRTVNEPVEITVTRIKLKKRTVEEVIKAPLIDQSEGAKKTVTKPGVDGLDLVTYLDTYHDNKLISTHEIARRTVTEAQASIILSLEYNGEIPEMKEAPAKYKEILNIECTAYCMPGNRTSTGKLAMVGYVAVDPTVIPYHTKMFICSPDGSLIYGYAQAEDCGGAIKGNRVDLYFDTEEECINFGRRPMIAYIRE